MLTPSKRSDYSEGVISFRMTGDTLVECCHADSNEKDTPCQVSGTGRERGEPGPLGSGFDGCTTMRATVEMQLSPAATSASAGRLSTAGGAAMIRRICRGWKSVPTARTGDRPGWHCKLSKYSGCSSSTRGWGKDQLAVLLGRKGCRPTSNLPNRSPRLFSTPQPENVVSLMDGVASPATFRLLEPWQWLEFRSSHRRKAVLRRRKT